jgi:hypothetical protein
MFARTPKTHAQGKLLAALRHTHRSTLHPEVCIVHVLELVQAPNLSVRTIKHCANTEEVRQCTVGQACTR